ncbi:hypothetical protein DFP73DRAFT_197839 [Morchella snyderi]|nr:hypothetical protein DFP73DRAFT_197839 [Morchella snyderi]
MAIDFNRLRTVQLVYDTGPGHRQSRNIIKAAANGTSWPASLRKMSVQLLIFDVCPLLELTSGLEELHVVSRFKECRRTAEFAEVVARKCKGLRALAFTKTDLLWQSPSFTLRDEDLTVIAGGCEGLEDIRVGVVLEEFESVIPTLALVPSVRYLHIDLARPEDPSSEHCLTGVPEELRPLDKYSWEEEGMPSKQKAAVDWAFKRAKSILKETDLKGLSVMGEMNAYIQEWVKPGVAVKDICFGELRGRLRFKRMGRGAWNEAFEPVGYSLRGTDAGSGFDVGRLDR